MCRTSPVHGTNLCMPLFKARLPLWYVCRLAAPLCVAVALASDLFCMGGLRPSAQVAQAAMLRHGRAGDLS